MKEMKTLTVNGVTYTVTDPDAASIDDATVGGNAWSSKNIVDKLCPAFTESGAIVTCEPVESYPLTVTAEEGATTITRCGKNLFDKSESKLKTISFIRSDGTSREYFGYEFMLPPGSYVLHATKASTYDEDYLYGVVCNLDNVVMQSWNPVYGKELAERPVTFTEWVKVYFYHGSIRPDNDGYLPTVLICFNRFNIQVEVGSKATAFEPYNGGTFNPGEPVPALPGVNTLWAESGEITVTGRADPAALNKRTEERLAALEAALVNT